MAENYVLLERVELNATAASVTFSNIPQSGYTDLKVVVSARTNRSSDGDYIYLSLNGAQANSGRYFKGYATTYETGTVSDNYLFVSSTNNTSNVYGNIEIHVPNYLSTTYKTTYADVALTTNSVTPSGEGMGGFVWSSGSASTSAVTSITLTGRFGSFIQYSTFSLYGLAASGTTPIATKASGGDTFYSDGTYWYHIFRTSGAFVPTQTISCDYLVVAGGGGGGASNGVNYVAGGGGGAGGYRTGSSFSVSPGTYTVTVGAGGAGSPDVGVAGSSGTTSIFSTISSTGGGGGGSGSVNNGLSGGSGGGSRGYSGTGGSGNAGGYSPVEGYAGGSATTTKDSGSGGGGASAAGSQASTTYFGGVGGNGTASSITGTSTTYAGGGGGGSYSQLNIASGGTGGGGSGGGGSNPGGTNPTAGTAALGGGGGGGYANANYVGSLGANGGSGVVIIRYAV